ncbi:gluconate 2-dehydrogenase subunit 3 family protein [Spirosoma flavum]|uniref:Gluconate 2-dehydrogenase subunit 3 family protein n=1 Tax=Spirosoma flavum TaxID=2048557 RepID=A0ABW6AQ74_9BACT
MKRRGVIKHLTLATGAFFITPAWATRWSKASVVFAPSFLSVADRDLLAEVVETIIPVTNSPSESTPGAKDLGVHLFVERMLADCYEKSTQQKARNGLKAVSAMSTESYRKPFEQADATQRLALLTRMANSTDANQQEFLTLMKSLTIQGYTTSEYVMTNFYHYVMAPGHYYGCVPAQALTQKATSNHR